MSTTSVGRAVEAAVAKHLSKKGYELIDQNWRTKWCEIDLVMKRNKIIYFIEVKFRRSPDQGEGLEYVTPKKLRQMTFAAEYWTTINKWEGNCELMVASVDGVNSTIRTQAVV